MRSSIRGITLIEALIAIAIIGIVFAVLASAQITNLRITSDARADTNLLAVAVREFEGVRTRVLSDFASYHRGCATAPADDVEVGVDCGAEGAGFEIVGPNGDDEDFVREGTVLVRIAVEDGRGNELEFSQVLSCLDTRADDLPTMVSCNVCLLEDLDEGERCGGGS